MKRVTSVQGVRWLKFVFLAHPDEFIFFCYDHAHQVYDQFTADMPFETKLELLALEVAATSSLETLMAQVKALYPHLEPLPPRPEADLRFIDQLSPPGGALREQPFYVHRPADHALQTALLKPRGMTATIHAPRQMGKTSLLIRGVEEARLANYLTVHVDFQGYGQEMLASSDILLRYLANLLIRKLRLDRAEMEAIWADPLSPYDKFNILLEDYILPTIPAPLVLAFDEMDGLLQCHFHDDFFSMVRFWFNQRAINPIWDKLNVIMVISTEPSLLIKDVHRSPFNVGEQLRLGDFDQAQVGYLNEQYHTPLPSRYLPEFMAWFGGQPYLTQQAFYTLVTQNLAWDELLEVATRDDGPFDGHLHRYLRLIREDNALHEAMKQVLQRGACAQPSFYRLLKAGLVRGEAQRAACRYRLYEQYLRARL